MGEIALRQNNRIVMGVHMPPALVGRWQNGQEVGQGLPPYASVEVYSADALDELLPADISRSKGNTTSYVVGLEEGRGIWFDFTRLPLLSHDIAVRISV